MHARAWRLLAVQEGGVDRHGESTRARRGWALTVNTGANTAAVSRPSMKRYMKREKDFYITENVIVSNIDREKGEKAKPTVKWVFNPEEFNPYNPFLKRMTEEEH